MFSVWRDIYVHYEMKCFTLRTLNASHRNLTHHHTEQFVRLFGSDDGDGGLGQPWGAVERDELVEEHAEKGVTTARANAIHAFFMRQEGLACDD